MTNQPERRAPHILTDEAGQVWLAGYRQGQAERDAEHEADDAGDTKALAAVRTLHARDVSVLVGVRVLRGDLASPDLREVESDSAEEIASREEICAHDHQTWPCATIRAIEGAQLGGPRKPDLMKPWRQQ